MRGHFFTMYLYQYNGSVEPLMYHVLRMSVFIILAQTLQLAEVSPQRCENVLTSLHESAPLWTNRSYFLCVAVHRIDVVRLHVVQYQYRTKYTNVVLPVSTSIL